MLMSVPIFASITLFYLSIATRTLSPGTVYFDDDVVCFRQRRSSGISEDLIVDENCMKVNVRQMEQIFLGLRKPEFEAYQELFVNGFLSAEEISWPPPVDASVSVRKFRKELSRWRQDLHNAARKYVRTYFPKNSDPYSLMVKDGRV